MVPAKGQYMGKDIERLSKFYQIPLNSPKVSCQGGHLHGIGYCSIPNCSELLLVCKVISHTHTSNLVVHGYCLVFVCYYVKGSHSLSSCRVARWSQLLDC